MNTSNFINLLEHPNNISASDIDNLRSIIDEYPYFQSARAIYLKGLHNTSSFKYNNDLKITAAYTTDRSILFDFITSDDFHQNKISSSINQNVEHLKNIKLKDIQDISVQKSVVIDDMLREEIKSSQAILDPNLFEEKTQHIKGDSSETEIIRKKNPEDTLQLGKPLQFDKNERHSFSEWLKLTRFKPIDRDNEDKTEDTNSKLRGEKYKMIDKFISSNPKIIPIHKEDTVTPVNIDNTYEPETLMTETLARIYLEQKNYSKAIQAYKILSLKYPEKSGFFADQIKAIKDIQ